MLGGAVALYLRDPQACEVSGAVEQRPFCPCFVVINGGYHPLISRIV